MTESDCAEAVQAVQYESVLHPTLAVRKMLEAKALNILLVSLMEFHRYFIKFLT
jgi:hypothetical protein